MSPRKIIPISASTRSRKRPVQLTALMFPKLIEAEVAKLRYIASAIELTDLTPSLIGKPRSVINRKYELTNNKPNNDKKTLLIYKMLRNTALKIKSEGIILL